MDAAITLFVFLCLSQCSPCLRGEL